MTKHLILFNNYLLLRIVPERIAYIISDASYSTMKLIGGEEHVFSFNLSAFEKQIEQQLGSDAQIFVRLGKSLIINSNYIYSINLTKQELILSDMSFSKQFVLTASKEALKLLKSVLEDSMKSRRIGI
jgi:DNA-binding LytR/AlgR family response regulator